MLLLPKCHHLIYAFQVITQQTDVMNLIRKAPWYDPVLRHRMYRVTAGGKLSVTFAERLYKNLYDARNAFFHGNPIHSKHWRFKGRVVSTSLGNVAPILYRTAVMSFLGWTPPLGPSRSTERLLEMMCNNLYEVFLLQFFKPSSWP